MPTRPLRRADLVCHELDGEMLIFDPVSMDTHRLNSPALMIWRLCGGRNDLRAITERLTEVYDVSDDSATEHVERICGQLHAMGLFAEGDSDAERSAKPC